MPNKQQEKNQLMKNKGILEYRIVDAGQKMKKIQEKMQAEGMNLMAVKIDKNKQVQLIKKVDADIIKYQKQIKTFQVYLQ